MFELLKTKPGLPIMLHNAPVSSAWHCKQMISLKRCRRITERFTGDWRFDSPDDCGFFLYLLVSRPKYGWSLRYERQLIKNPDHHISRYKSDPNNTRRSFIEIKFKEEKSTLHKFQSLKKTHFRDNLCTLVF